MRSAVNERAIVELFNTIDIVSKSNDENDTIMDKVKNRIVFYIGSYFDRQKERRAKKAMIHKYKVYLLGFQELLSKQMSVLDSLSNKSDKDIRTELFISLRNELTNYSIEALKLEFADMSECLSSDIVNIYAFVHIHDLLDKYNKIFEKDISVTEVSTKQEKPILSDWKTYYYMAIDRRKRLRFNEKLFSDFISRTHTGLDNDLFIKRGILCTTDFTGRLSKNIFYQRKRLNLTQVQLAGRSGVDRTMIAKIEKVQQKPTLETAIKLLSALNLELAICPALEGAK